MGESIYVQNGYKNRRDYLLSLADVYGVEHAVVFEIAGALGPGEDFDGLIMELEDFTAEGFDDEI
jgi:hypothetical protein